MSYPYPLPTGGAMGLQSRQNMVQTFCNGTLVLGTGGLPLTLAGTG